MSNVFIFFNVFALLCIGPVSGQEAKLIFPIGHVSNITQVEISSDGQRAITAADDGVKLWKIPGGKLLGTLHDTATNRAGHWRASISKDSRFIITYSLRDSLVYVFESRTGKLLYNLIGHKKDIADAEFSLDGTKIVTSSWDHSARIWSTESGQLLHILSGHRGAVWTHFSPDGNKVITSSFDSTVKIWATGTGNLLASHNLNAGIYDCQFFDNESFFVPNRPLRVYHAITGQITKRLDVIAHDVNSGLTRLLSNNENSRKTDIYDIASGELVFSLNGHGYKFSVDGKQIFIVTEEGAFSSWDVATGKLVHGTGSVPYMRSSPVFYVDDQYILSASGAVSKLYKRKSGKLLSYLRGNTSRIQTMALSHDGKRIATLSDSLCRIWDVQSGKTTTVLAGRLKQGADLVFSPDGKALFSHYYDDDDEDNRHSEARLWDVETGSLIRDLQQDLSEVEEYAFSPDSKKFSAVEDFGDTVFTWDVSTGKLLHHIPYRSYVRNFQFNPQSTNIITTSFDSTIYCWDAESGKLVYKISAALAGYRPLHFSADGSVFFGSLTNKAMCIWNARNGDIMKSHVLKQKTTADLEALALDRSGAIALAKKWDTAYFWNTATNTIVSELLPVEFDKVILKFFEIRKIDYSKLWTEANKPEIRKLLLGYVRYDSAVFFHGGKTCLIIANFEKIGTTAMIVDIVSGKIVEVLDIGVRFLSVNTERDQIATISGYGHSIRFSDINGRLIRQFSLPTGSHASAFSWESNVAAGFADSEVFVTSAEESTRSYRFISVDSADYLLYDQYGRFDGTEAARKMLYLTCGEEIIDLEQTKDQLWIPKLAKRKLSGEAIQSKTLRELAVCGVLPQVSEESNEIFYRFRIKPRGGGLGTTSLFINGIEINRYSPSSLSKSNDGYLLSVKRSELLPYFTTDENEVSVKSYTSNNEIFSRGIAEPGEGEEKTFVAPNLYAVLIGVSDYKGDQLDLKYAAKDASDISSLVQLTARKFLNKDTVEHVFVYELTTSDKRHLWPEKQAVKKVFSEIGKKAQPNDIILVFFAGHGVMAGEKKQFYFLTADASSLTATGALEEVSISTHELAEWLKPQNIKAQKRVLIFDACNSGQAIKDFVKLGGDDQQYLAARSDEDVQQIKALDKLNEKAGLFILSASASNQVAYEMGKFNQGLLTYSLLKAVKLQPDILEDGKFLNVSRWFNTAEKIVSDVSKQTGSRQDPQIVSNSNFNIGVVDNEVVSAIQLSHERPSFKACNFQNADEAAEGDNLQLNDLVNQHFHHLSARGGEANFLYFPGVNSNDAYSLTGRYGENGNVVTIKILLKKGNATKARFTVEGTKDKLAALSEKIVQKALSEIK